MRGALKAVVLILLCQTSFATGLNSGSTQAPYGFTGTDVPTVQFHGYKTRFNSGIQLFPNSRSAFLFPGEGPVFMQHNLKFNDEFDSGLPRVSSPDRILPSTPASAGHTPEPVIVRDPTLLPETLLEDPAKKIALQIIASQVRFQYTLYDLPDTYKRKYTVIERSPRALDSALSDTDFQFILMALPDEIFLIDDVDNSRFAPQVRLVSNAVLQHILSIIIPVDARYVAIYNNDGTIIVKILYADGRSRIITREEILMKFGEWFYEFFDKFFEHADGYAEPYSAQKYQSQSIVIPRKTPRKSVKGDPENKKDEPVDGQVGSKSNSGNNTPPASEPNLALPATGKNFPEPFPDTPTYTAQSSRESDSSQAVLTRKKVKPKHRFKVAKAISELAAASDLRNQGVKKLAEAIKKQELKEHFQNLEGFPVGKSINSQITWLLDNGRAIELSRLIVGKAKQQWLDQLTNTLISRQLERARSTRRTTLASQNASLLTDQLDKLLPAPEEDIAVAKPKQTDSAVLKSVLSAGWQIILANEKKSHIYHSAEQRGLLANAGVDNIEEKLTVSTQTALEYLLWSNDLQALGLSKLIAKLVPMELEKEIRNTLQSSSDQPGFLENFLGIASNIRLLDHPAAGGGHLTLGPSKKHIKVSYFSDQPQDYVDIEISIEFSNFIIMNPIREQNEVPLTIILRSVYRHVPGSYDAQSRPKQWVVIASDSSNLLPKKPVSVQIQQWTEQLREAQTKAFTENMLRHEDRLREWENREPVHLPVDIVKLKKDSSTLKRAMQHFTLNFEYARNWSELPQDQLERVTNSLLEALEQYQQLLNPVLTDESLFQGSTHQAGWELVQGYRRYVQDMESVYSEMMRINQRRHQLTREDFNRIDELTRETAIIGGRARNLQSDELPKRRTRLRNEGQLTDEQYTRTEQLRNLYYPLTTGFNIARAQTLFQPPQYNDISDEQQRRSYINVPDATDHPAPPETPTQPFTYDQEDIEAEELQDPAAGIDDGIPTDVDFSDLDN